jgi:hypothetical protein
MSICCYGSMAARKSWQRICDHDLYIKKLAARKHRFQSASATVGCQTDISLTINQMILESSQAGDMKPKSEEQPDDVIVAMFQYMKS